jgi:membrane protease YdiL (CAAX protease family)
MIACRAGSSTLPAVDPRMHDMRLGGSAIVGAATLAAIAVVALSSDPWQRAVMLLIAPVLEEAAFRAGLQEWLLRQRRAPALANLATAGAFVLGHCLLRGLSATSLAVAGPALLLGWVYGRYRSLRLCIALHMLMNLIWLAPSHWLMSYPPAL